MMMLRQSAVRQLTPVNNRSAAGQNTSARKRPAVPVMRRLVQRKIVTGKEQYEYPDPETAFHALRSSFSDVDGALLYAVLQDIDREVQSFYDLRNLKHEIVRRLKAKQPVMRGGAIDDVMAINDLAAFIDAQDKYQITINNMDGLQSAGFEFEFASFKQTRAAEYTEKELIPSHQLMAHSLKLGDLFNLGWRLESDSFNTLELVTPPLVFPKNEAGTQKRDLVKKDISDKTTGLSAGLGNQTTLPAVASALSAMGMGKGWTVENQYSQYGVIKKQKGGAVVYDQTNVSLYAHEIGMLLEKSFRAFDHLKESFQGTPPQNIARKVRYAFGLVDQEGVSAAVSQAVAIFSRYASNAIAIPSMRYRQDNNTRFDTMPTEVKETFGLWAKTDALNLLKNVLVSGADIDLFCGTLLANRAQILKPFTDIGESLKQAAADVPVTPQLKEFVDQAKAQNVGATGAVIAQIALQARAQFPVQHGALAQQRLQAMTGYVQLMISEVTAFIDRAMAVRAHVENPPQSTTKDFLSETYGTGEGVRKGTYLKNVPTSTGPMYVTEIR